MSTPRWSIKSTSRLEAFITEVRTAEASTADQKNCLGGGRFLYRSRWFGIRIIMAVKGGNSDVWIPFVKFIPPKCLFSIVARSKRKEGMLTT